MAINHADIWTGNPVFGLNASAVQSVLGEDGLRLHGTGSTVQAGSAEASTGRCNMAYAATMSAFT